MRARRTAVAVLAVCGFLVLAPGTARAHAAFVSSQPEAGAELGTAPGVVVLRFTEPLNTKLSRAAVTAPDGRRFEGGVSGNDEIRVPLSTNAHGVYEVDWTTVSVVDGHTLTGSFRFGVGVSPGPGGEGTASSEPRPTDLLLAVGRTVEDTALLLALGMLLIGRLSRREPPLAWVKLRLPAVLAVAFVSGLAVVFGEALAAAPSPSIGPVVTYLTTGLPGAARLARLVLEAVALVVSPVAAGWTAVPVCAAVVALAGAGHAAAVHPRWWAISIDAVHVLSAGAWAGGILALAMLRPPGGWRSPDGRAMLQRFSPVALFAFTVSVGTGLLRGVQEVGHLRDLFTTSYGLLVLLKALGVVLTTQLSLLAWRRVIGSLRLEALVVVLVIGAAAVLAAFPLPPARLVEAEAVATPPSGEAGLPKARDLTLGGHAGQVLVGLTLRPGAPGANDVFVYLLPLDGPAAAARLRAEVTVDGGPMAIRECGPTCRIGEADLRGRETLRVLVEGPTGGTASFALPALPAQGGSRILERMMTRMHELETYRLDETLSSGLATVRSTYAFEAPNRFESDVSSPARTTRTVGIGGTRYLKQDEGAWQVERGGPPIPVPSFVWDFFRPFIDARVLGMAVVDGVRTRIVAFFGDSGGTPVWFRLWIDSGGLVHRAEMRALGHFMDHRYYGFDAPIAIRPPAL